MQPEMLILALGALLLIAQIFLAGHLKTKQYGADWNIGARDEPLPPLNVHAARASRAQANLMETLPVAIIALFGVVVAGRTGDMTAIGGWLWLAMRVVYVPIYLMGIKGLRTIVFLLSLVGLIIVLWPLLFG